MPYWTEKKQFLTAAGRDFTQGEPLYQSLSPVLPPASQSLDLGRHLTHLCLVSLICFLNLSSIGLLTWRHLCVWVFFFVVVVALVCLFCLFLLLNNTLIIYTACELPCLALPVQKPLRRTDSEPKFNCYKLQPVKQLSNFKCLRYDCKKIEC